MTAWLASSTFVKQEGVRYDRSTDREDRYHGPV